MTTYEPKGVQFNKTQTEHQLFPEEYFTGTDCFVYFGDVWMDDLTGLAFSLSEKTYPIFSYSSRTWDYVSRGKRTVQGQFRMAFKEAGHLFSILDHIGQLGAGSRVSALNYWMNQEKDPVGAIGGIQDRIEDILNRYHGDKSKKAPTQTVIEKQTAKFKWPTMKKGDDDTMAKFKNQEERYGFTTAIRQAQTWLKNNGYGWEPTKFTWGKYYNGDTWRQTTSSSAEKTISVKNAVFSSSYINNKIGANRGDWYMLLRYQPGTGRSIGGYDAYSTFEAQLQKRLDQYPGGLKGYYMGGQHGVYDGRYGDTVRNGVKMLLDLAEEDDGSNGYWVSKTTKDLLEQGLKVNGRFDFATKLAVWAYQQDMISKGKLKKSKPDGIIDSATRDIMTEEVPVEVTVEGKSLYRPEEMYESRVSLYEKEIWGRPFVEDGEQVRKQESFFYRGRTVSPREGFEHNPSKNLEQTGFDIYINYGPLPQYIQSRLDKVTSDLDNISFNTTVKAIRNVQITDVEQVLDAKTGEPIEEIYTFIAQDLD